MEYDKKIPDEDALLMVEEPATAYAVGYATAKPWAGTDSAATREKAINAVRKMQEISASTGNDKMTLDEINAIIADVRKSKN